MAVYLSTLRSVNVDFLAQTRDFRKYCIPSEASSALIKMFTIDQVLSVEARQKEQNNFYHTSILVNCVSKRKRTRALFGLFYISRITGENDHASEFTADL